MGFGMLKGNHSQTAPSNDQADAEPSITPLVLFAASPGTITGVITLSIAHTGSELPVTALVGVGIAGFRADRRFERREGLVEATAPGM